MEASKRVLRRLTMDFEIFPVQLRDEKIVWTKLVMGGMQGGYLVEQNI